MPWRRSYDRERFRISRHSRNCAKASSTRSASIEKSRARRISATSALPASIPNAHSSCASATAPSAEKPAGLPLPAACSIRTRLSRRFPGIQITVPPTLVLATDIFDRFVADNDLLDFAMHCPDDEEIVERFVTARLPATLIRCAAGFPGENAVSAGGTLVEPAGGLAVPAILRRI